MPVTHRHGGVNYTVYNMVETGVLRARLSAGWERMNAAQRANDAGYRRCTSLFETARRTGLAAGPYTNPSTRRDPVSIGVTAYPGGIALNPAEVAAIAAAERAQGAWDDCYGSDTGIAELPWTSTVPLTETPTVTPPASDKGGTPTPSTGTRWGSWDTTTPPPTTGTLTPIPATGSEWTMDKGRETAADGGWTGDPGYQAWAESGYEDPFAPPEPVAEPATLPPAATTGMSTGAKIAVAAGLGLGAILLLKVL